MIRTIKGKEEARTANSTYQKVIVKWLNEALCFVSSSLQADSFVLRNCQLLAASNKHHIIKIVLIGLLAMGCSGQGGYEATKQSLAEQERSRPVTFLSVVEQENWVNLIGETVVTGKIASSATVAEYKDIVLLFHFYTKTDTRLETKEVVLYEFVAPGSQTPFKLRFDAPEATEKVGIDIKSASNVQ